MRGMQRSAHFDGTELESDQHLLQHRNENRAEHWNYGRDFDQNGQQKVCHLENTVTCAIYDVVVKPSGRCGT